MNVSACSHCVYGINRIRLEFKEFAGDRQMRQFQSINRIRLEFKVVHIV